VAEVCGKVFKHRTKEVARTAHFNYTRDAH
jgi:hypothetical protein